ncbi:MAG: hypothetical protein RL204_1528 [Bacteroidota bacterium]|jgi:glycosyltransferase involved in cell wall biosynthesis
MKILVLTDGITPFVTGGMQKHSANLVKYMIKRGHQITLVHCVTGRDKIPTQDEVRESLDLKGNELLTVKGYRFPSLGSMPGHYLKESYAYSSFIYKDFASTLNEFDFIYAKGFCAWTLIEKKKKGEKMPPIGVKFHGYEMFQRLNGFSQKIQAWMLRGPVKWNNKNADVVFSYGPGITEIIESIGVSNKNIIEIPSGIDNSWLVESNSIRKGPLRFLFIGRYEVRKGIEELNQVISSLPQLEDVAFDFIGEIPMSKRLKRSDITYHGILKDAALIQSIMDKCDVLLVPSHSEGMPNVILEGMSRGMATIATNVGAVRALVNSENGYVINVLDQQELKQTIEKAIHLGRQDAFEKGERAQKMLNDKFRWDKIAEETEKQLATLLRL